MSIAKSIRWKTCRFDQLSPREVYLLAKLRVDVFVVEQSCAYNELDGQDLFHDTVHIVGNVQGVPVAYARILAPKCVQAGRGGQNDTAVHIGRVVVEHNHRGRGLATALMHRALAYCESHFTGHDQALAAQVSVEGLYEALGFATRSAAYLEDGIAHVDMVRRGTLR